MRALGRHAWTGGLLLALLLLLLLTRAIQPNFGATGLESLARASLPFAFATAAMAVVVIAGGIDLSIASMMAVCGVASAVLMEAWGPAGTVPGAPRGPRPRLLMGAVNGALIVLTRVPDIVVTLSMLFVWEGTALLILNAPGGAVTPWLSRVILGAVAESGPLALLPWALVVLAVILAALWLPLRRARLGLSIYAVGSRRMTAAFRSGVGGPDAGRGLRPAGPARAFGASSLTLSTAGRAHPGPYLLAASPPSCWAASASRAASGASSAPSSPC
jgi:ribose transport system permease protein